MKPAAEIRRLFRDHQAAVTRTSEIAARCRFSLDELRYEYPDEIVPEGRTPQEHLADLTWEGAARRYPTALYPGGVPNDVRARLAEELHLIEELKYAPYFLTVHDIVRYAESEGI
ncbi:MAG TPA: error-prone DNA polymerase, partial [Stellaceae bacterium]|nr:error-prone DNA polymerase [Stellaceae bacterium]